MFLVYLARLRPLDERIRFDGPEESGPIEPARLAVLAPWLLMSGVFWGGVAAIVCRAIG